jgi:hypothetical protein
METVTLSADERFACQKLEEFVFQHAYTQRETAATVMRNPKLALPRNPNNLPRGKCIATKADHSACDHPACAYAGEQSGRPSKSYSGTFLDEHLCGYHKAPFLQAFNKKATFERWETLDMHKLQAWALEKAQRPAAVLPFSAVSDASSVSSNSRMWMSMDPAAPMMIDLTGAADALPKPVAPDGMRYVDLGRLGTTLVTEKDYNELSMPALLEKYGPVVTEKRGSDIAMRALGVLEQSGVVPANASYDELAAMFASMVNIIGGSELCRKTASSVVKIASKEVAAQRKE